MVALTTLTLWSLGQALVVAAPATDGAGELLDQLRGRRLTSHPASAAAGRACPAKPSCCGPRARPPAYAASRTRTPTCPAARPATTPGANPPRPRVIWPARRRMPGAAWRNRSGAGLPWCDVLGTEEPARRTSPAGRSFARFRRILAMAAARRDARGVAGGLDRVDRSGHPVHGQRAPRREDLDVALREPAHSRGDVAPDPVLLDLGAHRRVGPADQALDVLRHSDIGHPTGQGARRRAGATGRSLSTRTPSQSKITRSNRRAVPAGRGDPGLSRRAPPARSGAADRRSGTHSRERPHLGEPVGDRRIERLGGGDGGLDRGQAQDPLGGRRAAGSRRRRGRRPDRGVGVLTTSRTSPERDQVRGSPARRRVVRPHRAWRPGCDA